MKKTLVILLVFGLALSGQSQTADFTFQSINGVFCSPSTIKFTKITTGSPTGYVWNFGNNAGSNQENPTYTYSNAGNYTVTLLVIYKKFTLSVSKNILINPGVTTQLGISRRLFCTPGTISFNTTSNTAISNYEWSFGENSVISSSASPTISHEFTNFGNFPISVKAIAATGCSGKSTDSILIQKPTISANISSLFGCVPSQVNFNASVAGIIPGFVTSYSWDFGDGSPQQATVPGYTSHIYNTAGQFRPRLHIVSSEGCTQDYNFSEVPLGMPPGNLVAYPLKTVFCGSESVYFVAKANNANKYYWDFSDGDTLSVTDTMIRHKLNRLGTKTVKVTAYFNGCIGETRSFTIEVIGTIAGFNYANTCNDKKTFTLHNQSQGNLSGLTWQLGDGSPLLSTASIVHTYRDTGTYYTQLTTRDSITGCTDTYAAYIYTADPVLVNPHHSLCKNDTTAFTIIQNYNNPKIRYTWNVLGLHEEMSVLNPYVTQAGQYGYFNENNVIIDNGPQYCKDTISLSHTVIVRGPILEFNAAEEICVSNPYEVINLSKPFVPSDQITEWKWDYGIQSGNGIRLGYQPPPFNYTINGIAFWGTYPVTLYARDMNGCYDSLSRQVLVKDIPFLRSIPDHDTICAGQSARLIAFHNDGINWFPGTDLSCLTCDTVFVHPQRSMEYYVTATNQYHCSVTDTIPVFVYEPFSASAVQTEYSICAGESARLDANPKDKMISWLPVEGLSGVTSFNPVVTPVTTTDYTANLKDSGSCFSSSVGIRVVVKSLPVVNAGPDKVFPYHTDFTITPEYSNNTRFYNWSPAGSLSCTYCPAPSGIANTSQHYVIKVISDSGCIAKDEININIDCKGMNLLLPTAFTPNNDNLNDYYYPITRGIRKVIRFAIYNRQGQMVFEAKDMTPNDKSKGWDGRFKGNPQGTGTFVYMLDTTCDSGELIQKKGSFMLIR